jgi:hypothetical protein
MSSSHTNLMIGTISLSSLHLALSLLLFSLILTSPNIITENYVKIFLIVSIVVNCIIYFLCLSCKNSNSAVESEHNSLMNTCMMLSLLHFIISFLMINFANNKDIILVFLAVSAVVNGSIVFTSNKCKNLEK